MHELSEIFRRVAVAARQDAETARQVRDSIAESGLLDVFGAGETLDVVDLLDAGGEEVLRARLKDLPLAQLRGIIAAHEYDAAKETARWRSTAKLIDFIVRHASQQLAEEQDAAASQPKAVAASWML
jgi:hypothetical protein